MADLAPVPQKLSGSWSSADDVKEKSASSVEEGINVEPEHLHTRRSMWKRVVVGNSDATYETKRAMKSRHLTMIGKWRRFPRSRTDGLTAG